MLNVTVPLLGPTSNDVEYYILNITTKKVIKLTDDYTFLNDFVREYVVLK